MAFRRWVAVIGIAVTVCVPGVEAQTPDCAAGLCTDNRVWPIAALTEEFRHGFQVAESEIDLLAALEQQRWREIRFRADAPARVYANLQPESGFRPSDWPEGESLATEDPSLNMLYSLDGNVYRPVASGFAAAEGALVSVIVGQHTERSDAAGATFFPARWTLAVTARRTWAQGGPRPVAADVPPLSRVPDDPRPEFDPLPSDPAAVESVECEGSGCPAADLPAVEDVVSAAQVAAPGGDAVAAELQAELARVGCYGAAVDGLWGPASRAAMAAFNRATAGDAPEAVPTPRALVVVARVSETVCPGD